MSEPYSVPSSQKDFENSNQSDTKTSVKNVNRNTVPQTDSSGNQSFSCSRAVVVRLNHLCDSKTTLILMM